MTGKKPVDANEEAEKTYTACGRQTRFCGIVHWEFKKCSPARVSDPGKRLTEEQMARVLNAVDCALAGQNQKPKTRHKIMQDVTFSLKTF